MDIARQGISKGWKSAQHLIALHARQVALAVGDDQLRPTLPGDAPEALAGLALACFDPAPENRPSFALIAHHLAKARAGTCP